MILSLIILNVLKARIQIEPNQLFQEKVLLKLLP